MQNQRQSISGKSDSGMSLVELLVYLGLLLVVVVILSGLLINLLNVQNRVVNAASASQQAQLIAQTLETGVRNATAIKLEQVSSTEQMVTLRSAQSASNLSWVCMAFYFNAANGGSVRYQRSPSAIAIPSAGQLGQWTLLGQGISASPQGNLFTLVGTRLSFNFASRVQNSPSTVINSQISARGGALVSAPCF